MSTILEALNSTEMEQTMNTLSEQISENITESLNLNLSDNVTKNITRNVYDIKTEISHINRSECINRILSQNSFECKNTNGITDFQLDQKILTDVVSNCYNSSQNLQNLIQDLKNTVEQEAKLKMNNSFSGIIESMGNAISNVVSAWGSILILPAIIAVFALFILPNILKKKNTGKVVKKTNVLFIKIKLIFALIFILALIYLFFECTRWNQWCLSKNDNN
jgi:gas vesicle protein